MAEDAFGEDTVDDVLEKSGLENGGAFTTVGNDPCSELIKIVMAFRDHSGIPTEDLQRKFGPWIMDHFVEAYAEMFGGKNNSFEMLEAVDGEIHVEVKKLYPNAELPVFATEHVTDDHLQMTNSSPRLLVEFCHGIIEACVAQYKQQAAIGRCPVSGDASATKFDIRLDQ